MNIVDKVELVSVEDLIPYHNNPKDHPRDQIDKIKSSIKNFGFTVPLVVDDQNEVIAGHARLTAAREIGIPRVPCVIRSDLTEAQARAFRIADNKVAESGWNEEALAEELDLLDLDDFNLDLTGFSMDERENLLPNLDDEDFNWPEGEPIEGAGPQDDHVVVTLTVPIERWDELQDQIIEYVEGLEDVEVNVS